MSSLLYITANPKSKDESFLDAYQKIKLDEQIIELDLYNMEKLPYIDT